VRPWASTSGSSPRPAPARTADTAVLTLSVRNATGASGMRVRSQSPSATAKRSPNNTCGISRSPFGDSRRGSSAQGPATYPESDTVPMARRTTVGSSGRESRSAMSASPRARSRILGLVSISRSSPGCARRSLGSAGATKRDASTSMVVSRTTPRGASRSRATRRRTSVTPRSVTSATATRASPTSVSAIARSLRVSNGAPTEVSSARTRRPTVVASTPRDFAAPAREPARRSARSSARSRQSRGGGVSTGCRV
jgi:hypothetical protein